MELQNELYLTKLLHKYSIFTQLWSFSRVSIFSLNNVRDPRSQDPRIPGSQLSETLSPTREDCILWIMNQCRKEKSKNPPTIRSKVWANYPPNSNIYVLCKMKIFITLTFVYLNSYWMLTVIWSKWTLLNYNTITFSW